MAKRQRKPQGPVSLRLTQEQVDAHKKAWANWKPPAPVRVVTNATETNRRSH